VNIAVKACTEANVADIGQCDGEFVVEAKLVLSVHNNVIGYDVVDIPSFRKRYGKDNVDYTTYVDAPDKAVFLAYVSGQIAGQVILRQNWNNYAYIEDIAVDRRFRRKGIGSALMIHATQWAKGRGLAGITLETQDNNVGACRFYKNCGFELRGFDTHLYKGIDSTTDEIALYWYLVFGKSST
jgi:ribosomal protein S18 acetylase RimI-like enzyme